MRKLKILLLLIGIAASLSMAVADERKILVTGATGRQGNAVIEALLARGFPVRGMTRKPDGEKARRLASLGVEIVRGDYRDPETLRAAMDGVHGVFFYSGLSRDEVSEGRNVIEASKVTGVRHFVYSSGAAAAPGRGMEGAAKTQVELELRRSGVPFTVLRPVAFMENFDGQQKRTASIGVVDSRAPNRHVYFIAVRDIGFFAAEAFSHPGEWLGRGEDIAGDSMTLAELARTFGEVMGREIGYHRQPLEEYLSGFPPPLRPLFRWYDEVGYSVDVAALRDQYPQLTTLEAYLRETGWEDWPAR